MEAAADVMAAVTAATAAAADATVVAIAATAVATVATAAAAEAVADTNFVSPMSLGPSLKRSDSKILIEES